MCCCPRGESKKGTTRGGGRTPSGLYVREEAASTAETHAQLMVYDHLTKRPLSLRLFRLAYQAPPLSFQFPPDPW